MFKTYLKAIAKDLLTSFSLYQNQGKPIPINNKNLTLIYYNFIKNYSKKAKNENNGVDEFNEIEDKGSSISKSIDFGHYEVIHASSIISLTASEPKLRIPSEIKRPEYAFELNPQGIPSPSGSRKPELKNYEDIERMKKSCQLARIVLNSAVNQVREGITTNQIDKFVHELIVSNGAYPSPLNYRGYPKSICTSVNNVACHGIPDDRPLIDGDIVNIDVTVFLNGFHGDCSETVLVGNVDDEGKRLVKIAQEALYKGIDICSPNVPFRQIEGITIENFAEENGFEVIPIFTGHGIGKYFHGPPDIFHIDYPYRGKMKPGMTFTVEPILSQGSCEVTILDDGWTAISNDHSRSAQFEHTILITDSGYEILTI